MMGELVAIGGIQPLMKILLEAGLLQGDCLTVTGRTLAENLADVAPYPLDQSIIAPLSEPLKAESHLRILYGNLAPDGAVAKITGKEGTQFTGNARVFHSEEEATDRIMDGTVVAGDVLVIRYEGPKGGPGMQEMLYPTSYLKSKGLGKACALITDGRFSGGTSGLSIGHCSPEAAEGGDIGLVESGDTIEIDIPNRSIRVVLTDAELAERRESMVARGAAAWKPVNRERVVSQALRAYAALTTSAARGAVRDLSQLDQ